MATERLQKRQPGKDESVMEKQRMEIQDQAYNICREFLQGAWASVSVDDFKITPLGGGLTNKLYICQLPQEYHQYCNKNCPPIVLLRIYGLIIQDFKAQIQESVVFSILAERNFGPRLFAVFPGGRLEEYISCRTLNTSDLQNCSNSRNIAQQLAIYHQMNMPVRKEPTFIMNKMIEYFRVFQDFHFEDEHVQRMFNKLKSHDLRGEIEYLKELIHNTNSPVVFCHNDAQEGNLLYVGNDGNIEQNPIHMIDFEYSSYNYRGFDVGNHFCEWMYDYSHKQWPYYSYEYDNFPTNAQQKLFIAAYLEQALKENPDLEADHRWSVEFMLKEANRFVLLSHLFWCFWSVIQAKMADIPFGYMEYCLTRLDTYFKHKNLIE